MAVYDVTWQMRRGSKLDGIDPGRVCDGDLLRERFFDEPFRLRKFFKFHLYF